jgi:hypothetical protein
MTDTPVGQLGAPKQRRYQWLYLASVGFAGLFMALMNAPSGYAPFLCGAGLRDVPCVSYTFLDDWPQFVTAGMWFVPIALNAVALVLLFKLGSNQELLDTAIWLLAVLAFGIIFIFVHHWHLVAVDRGVFIEAPALHRWSISGLVHYAFEYAIIPLGLVGLVVVLPTWLVRRRRVRRASQPAKHTQGNESRGDVRRALISDVGQA